MCMSRSVSRVLLLAERINTSGLFAVDSENASEGWFARGRQDIKQREWEKDDGIFFENTPFLSLWRRDGGLRSAFDVDDRKGCEGFWRNKRRNGLVSGRVVTTTLLFPVKVRRGEATACETNYSPAILSARDNPIASTPDVSAKRDNVGECRDERNPLVDSKSILHSGTLSLFL